MERKIRQGVFETNSSSTHSVSIADSSKDFLMDTSLLPDQNGIVELTGGEFGWDFSKYNDAETKANYMAIYSRDDEEKRQMLIDVIKKQTGADVVVCKIGESYIDHQSDAGENGYTRKAGKGFDSEETLRQFIFNKNSWLFTGNDNSSPDQNFYDVPEFKNGKIIKPTYKYELKIQGLDKTAKFKSRPDNEETKEAIYSLLQHEKYDKDYFIIRDDSVYAQMFFNNNGKKYFEYSSYKKEPDLKNKTIFLIKDAWGEAEKIYKEKHPNEKWEDGGYDKCKKIEEKLYSKKNSEFIASVKFDVVEL